MKRFWDGLIFGTGFSIAFTIISYLSTTILYPMTMNHGSEQTQESFVSSESKEKVQFYELPFEDQIKNASAIIVTKYETVSDGKTVAIIEEIHLRSPDVKIYFEVGDEYPDGSFYKEKDTKYGEGSMVLLVNSPAEIRSSNSLFSGRIGAYGNMSLKMAINLFNEKNT